MIPYVKGQVASQAHVAIPEGLCEEEFGRQGFFGRYAHLYRSAPPVGWSHIEGELRPRLYNAVPWFTQGTDEVLSGRQVFLANQDVALATLQIEAPLRDFFRNADSDEIFFVHRGFGRLITDFGPLAYEQGDYLVIPRGTVYTFRPQSPTSILVIESASEVGFPDKGMLGQHALFDPAVLKVPSPEDFCPEDLSLQGSQQDFCLMIKRAGAITRVHYPFCPINTVGWKGTLSVWQLNVRDIRPVISERYHLPPSAHTTFVAHGFVVCTFLPRGLETGDSQAMRVPFYHSNIDYDEVLFYHDGEFFSREGIKPGMVTFHPQGIHHGPQAKAIERGAHATRTNEIAVMIDTRRALIPTNRAQAIESQDYWRSWMA